MIDIYYIIEKNDRYQRYQQLVSLERPAECFSAPQGRRTAQGHSEKLWLADATPTGAPDDATIFWGPTVGYSELLGFEIFKKHKWNNNSDPNLKVTGHPGHPARVCISQVLALTESVDKLKRSVDRKSRANRVSDQENTPCSTRCRMVKRALVPCGCDLPGIYPYCVGYIGIPNVCNNMEGLPWIIAIQFRKYYQPTSISMFKILGIITVHYGNYQPTSISRDDWFSTYILITSQI